MFGTPFFHEVVLVLCVGQNQAELRGSLRQKVHRFGKLLKFVAARNASAEDFSYVNGLSVRPSLGLGGET